MRTNVGTADRIVRIIIGAAICGIGWYFKSWWGLIGLIPILTGAVGYCTLYSLLGINTGRNETSDNRQP